MNATFFTTELTEVTEKTRVWGKACSCYISDVFTTETRRKAEDARKIGEDLLPVKAIKADSHRAAEYTGKDNALVRLSPDLIRSSLRSLPLDQARGPELVEGRL